jgi:hypothetical protein
VLSPTFDPGFIADISNVIFTAINRFYPKAQLRTWSGHFNGDDIEWPCGCLRHLVTAFHLCSATQRWAGTHYSRLPGGRNSRTRVRRFHERASVDSFTQWGLQLAAICGSCPIQPYDPNKIPILFIHGLISSPVSWQNLTNDLCSDPKIFEHYHPGFSL